MLDAIRQKHDELTNAFAGLLPALREHRATLVTELEDVDEFIADIEQRTASSVEHKPKRRRRKASKPATSLKACATGPEIEALIIKCLQSKTEASADEIEKYVLDELKGQQRNRSMASKLVGDYLRSGLVFETIPGIYSLKSQKVGVL